MKAKSLICAIAVVLFAWAMVTPAFGAALPLPEQEIKGVPAGKGVSLTDAQLDAVTGGESLACGSAAETECLSPTEEGPRITIKLWDDWVKRTQVEGGGASPQGLVQSNTAGTVQFNSTMSK
jgi:hypothetical protein